MQDVTDNRLLKRQLKKAHISDIKNIDENTFKVLLAQIEQTYIDSQNDRYILERSIEISSKEMVELNQSLEKRVHEEVEKNREKDKQLFQQTRLAQMGEMISMIAHQWRQPLSTIGVTAMGIGIKLQGQKYDLSKEEDRGEFTNYLETKLNKIESYVQHLSNTIDDFRTFFSPNKLSEEVYINNLLEKSLSLLEGGFTGANITITQRLESTNMLHTYPNELIQVFLNIFKNTIDNFRINDIASPCLSITSFEKEDFITIEIFDNGGGIPEEIMEKIFHPYFSTKTEKNGTGLGLYMSKTIIEDHCHGKLTVSNENNGACFTIKLPLKISK